MRLIEYGQRGGRYFVLEAAWTANERDDAEASESESSTERGKGRTSGWRAAAGETVVAAMGAK
ncbi:hypothetical protein WS62_05395 [Burkholderia sp. ABCPW 14]|uniref:hypothetical protein n=1 Tax=Burkholderia sp. ABCPW 14 TaxID=1637860 RepID=UPI000770C8CA|nr:hypothetical protein [Burkholderia sp. ABCPW 14]KVD74469.1 hypothetical protein WS62_05395 [Burkholderia sp. ABCPW 14]